MSRWKPQRLLFALTQARCVPIGSDLLHCSIDVMGHNLPPALQNKWTASYVNAGIVVTFSENCQRDLP
jgi:hypothetical protein